MCAICPSATDGGVRGEPMHRRRCWLVQFMCCQIRPRRARRRMFASISASHRDVGPSRINIHRLITTQSICLVKSPNVAHIETVGGDPGKVLRGITQFFAQKSPLTPFCIWLGYLPPGNDYRLKKKENWKRITRKRVGCGLFGRKVQSTLCYDFYD